MKAHTIILCANNLNENESTTNSEYIKIKLWFTDYGFGNRNRNKIQNH